MDKELEFNVYENMTNIVDSMQFSSGTIIADLVGNNIEAYIIVHGEVSVTFNDENYDDPADFPDELKQLISQEKNWKNDDRVYVSLNNWFDIVVNDRCDTDDVDIARAGTAELYSLLSYAVNEKIEAGEIQSNKLPSTLSEYIKGGGNEYLQYSYTLPNGVYETIRDMGANEKIHLDGYYNNVVLEITKDAEYDIKNLVTVKFQLDGKNIAATYNIHITELEDALTAIRNGISHRLVDESRGFAEIVADVNIETARQNEYNTYIAIYTEFNDDNVSHADNAFLNNGLGNESADLIHKHNILFIQEVSSRGVSLDKIEEAIPSLKSYCDEIRNERKKPINNRIEKLADEIVEALSTALHYEILDMSDTCDTRDEAYEKFRDSIAATIKSNAMSDITYIKDNIRSIYEDRIAFANYLCEKIDNTTSENSGAEKKKQDIERD